MPRKKEPQVRHGILRPRYAVLGALAALVVVYAVAGFMLVPWLARRELPRLVEGRLHHRASIGRIAFNPFTLSLQATGFSLQQTDGRPVLGFGEATVDLAWSSLFRRAWVLSEVKLVNPSVHVVVSKAGRLNLAELAPDSGAANSSGLPRFSLGHVSIANGLVQFEDEREGFRNRIERLSLELSSLSSRDSDRGPYTLVGQMPSGATLGWKGELSLTPLIASGTLALRNASLAELNPYLDDLAQAKILAGRADLELPYRFALTQGKPRFTVTGAKLGARDLELAAQGQTAPFAKLGRFALEGLDFDSQTRLAAAKSLRVSGVQAGAAPRQAVNIADISAAGMGFDSDANALDVENIRVGGFEVDAALEAGKLSLLDMMPAGQTQQGVKPGARKFAARLKSVELADGKIAFADRDSGMSLALERLNGKLTDVSSDASKPLAFDFTAGVRGGGKIGAQGRAVPSSGVMEAKAQAFGVALAPLQPLMARYASAKLDSGEASFAGTVKTGGKGPKLSYAGSASVVNVAIGDRAGARLIGWKSLATDTLRLTLSPNRVEVDELRWSAPAGRLAIATDGTTNIGRAFARKGTAPDAAKDSEKPDAEDAFPVAVRRVRVDQGLLDFSDDSISPGFRAGIAELAGTVNGISSDRSTRSNFTLEGRVGEYGFARLFGALNPFALRERSNFRVQFRDLDVATVSPYSMRFAGYRIASGRLSLDLNYRVNAGILEGDNKITLDKFVLGERVESPDALKLPLELAVALLKDPDGRIDLEVPIKGSLDDLQFSYSTIIWNAIGNVIRNIVSAPFRALAHLFGGDAEEVGKIAFDPGSSRLLPPEREKLGHVLEALAKRPEVKLVIPGQYDAEADARALKRSALAREIGKRAGFAMADDQDPGPLSIEDRPTRAALRALFAERVSQAELDKFKTQAEAKERETAAAGGQKLSLLDKVKTLAAGEPQVADPREFYFTLIRRLRDSQPLPANALADLAQKRAAAIEGALGAAGAEPARVTTSTAAPVSNAEAKQVSVQLGFAAR